MKKTKLCFRVSAIIEQDTEGVSKKQQKADMREVREYCMNHFRSMEFRRPIGLDVLNVRVKPIK